MWKLQDFKISRFAFFIFHNFQNVQVWRLQDFKISRLAFISYCRVFKVLRLQDFKISCFAFFCICFEILRCEKYKISKIKISRPQDPHCSSFRFFLFSEILTMKIARFHDFKIYIFVFQNFQNFQMWTLQDFKIQDLFCYFLRIFGNFKASRIQNSFFFSFPSVSRL